MYMYLLHIKACTDLGVPEHAFGWFPSDELTSISEDLNPSMYCMQVVVNNKRARPSMLISGKPESLDFSSHATIKPFKHS